ASFRRRHQLCGPGPARRPAVAELLLVARGENEYLPRQGANPVGTAHSPPPAQRKNTSPTRKRGIYHKTPSLARPPAMLSHYSSREADRAIRLFTRTLPGASSLAA